jgi:hypothetical protein
MNLSLSKAPRRKLPRGKTFTIAVSAELISMSKERDSSHCMTAEAIRAAVPWARSIAVDLQTIRFSDPEKRLRYTYLTPRLVQVELVNFDQGITPDPFDFRLSGAHVTSMCSRKPSGVAPQPISDKKRASIMKNRIALTKTVVVPTNSKPGATRRAGGRTAPLSPFARRRQFGLRALAR